MIKLSMLIILAMVSVTSSAATINDSNKVTNEVRGYLEEIMKEAKLSSITVSSGSRTATQQASVMYDYYLRKNAPNCKCANCDSYNERKTCALNSYGSIGDAAINAITDWGNREQSIEQMTKVINENIAAAGTNRNQMAHVPLDGRYAVDVKPSSVSDHEAFKKAVKNHKSVIESRFYWPGKLGGPAETAFHIEFNVKN